MAAVIMVLLAIIADFQIEISLSLQNAKLDRLVNALQVLRWIDFS
jgi:hypothetical protein